MPANRISEKLVFAEIHPWSTTAAVSGYYTRWNDTGHNPVLSDIPSVFWPNRGLYSMADPASNLLLGADLVTAGVDVAVIDWVNVYTGEQNRVSNILTSNMPVKSVVMVDIEPGWNPESFAQVQARMDTAIFVSTNNPWMSNIYKDPVSNLPVIFVYDPGAVGTIETWNSLLNFYKVTYGAIFIAGLGVNTPLVGQWFGGGSAHVTASLFDGFTVYAGKNNELGASSDVANFQWAIYNVYQAGVPRGQFIVGEVVPGFDNRANCNEPSPVVVDREAGAVFNRKWANLISDNSNGVHFDHAYVPYHNDGEDNGIEPVSGTPPIRGTGWANCSGRLPRPYEVYGMAPDAYLNLNRHWVAQFTGVYPWQSRSRRSGRKP